MSDFQTPEDFSLTPQQSGQLVSLDECKSLFYLLWCNGLTEAAWVEIQRDWRSLTRTDQKAQIWGA